MSNNLFEVNVFSAIKFPHKSDRESFTSMLEQKRSSVLNFAKNLIDLKKVEPSLRIKGFRYTKKFITRKKKLTVFRLFDFSTTKKPPRNRNSSLKLSFDNMTCTKKKMSEFSKGFFSTPHKEKNEVLPFVSEEHRSLVSLLKKENKKIKILGNKTNRLIASKKIVFKRPPTSERELNSSAKREYMKKPKMLFQNNYKGGKLSTMSVDKYNLVGQMSYLDKLNVNSLMKFRDSIEKKYDCVVGNYYVKKDERTKSEDLRFLPKSDRKLKFDYHKEFRQSKNRFTIKRNAPILEQFD